MSLSRTALVLGFLVLNACGAEAVTASSAREPSLPSGAPAVAPQGNTPSSGERPMVAFDRPTAGGHAVHEPRTLSLSCRSCRY